MNRFAKTLAPIALAVASLGAHAAPGQAQDFIRGEQAAATLVTGNPALSRADVQREALNPQTFLRGEQAPAERIIGDASLTRAQVQREALNSGEIVRGEGGAVRWTGVSAPAMRAAAPVRAAANPGSSIVRGESYAATLVIADPKLSRDEVQRAAAAQPIVRGEDAIAATILPDASLTRELVRREAASARIIRGEDSQAALVLPDPTLSRAQVQREAASTRAASAVNPDIRASLIGN